MKAFRFGTVSFMVAYMAIQFAAPSPAEAQIESVRIAQGLLRPVFLTSPPGDQRLFIIEQQGRIRIWKNGVLLPTPFLDISDKVMCCGLQGLLGLAFPASYQTSGFFYVNYTDTSGNTQIARYRVSNAPDIADPDSRLTVMQIQQPNGLHNGGSMAFAPDGTLFIGMGDSGPNGDPANNAQNPALLLGKILRIDVENGLPYSIPADNPFVGVPGFRGEIWDLGVRNPWGVSFDHATGDLWIADVGQSAWEEVDLELFPSAGGRNYGWRRMEGSHCYDPPSDCNDGTLTLPIHDYSHGGSPFRCSISGGCVYRGAGIPSLGGAYFFGDYCSRQIWSLRYEDGVVRDLRDWTAQLEPSGPAILDEIVGLCTGSDGEVYIVDRGDAGDDGEIYKIVLNPFSDVLTNQGDRGLRFVGPIPNPSAAGVEFRLVLPAATGMSVEAFAPDGRLVRNLVEGPLGEGEHSIHWDCLDDQGRPVPAGLYFLRARGKAGEAITRVSIVR